MLGWVGFDKGWVC